MTRIYCPKELIIGKQFVVNERRQVHYLRDVLRLRVNDEIIVFDGQGNEYYCQLDELSKRSARLFIKEIIRVKPQHKPCLAVACALPKQKSRFDDLVDKLTQLGVDKIIPMITERVIIRRGSNQKRQSHQRWCKIAEEACAQCGRSALPVIEPVKAISQVLVDSDSYDLKLIPTLTERMYPLHSTIGESAPDSFNQDVLNLKDSIPESFPKSILAMIGPEGDFTGQELEQARKAGFIPVSLGKQVLRVDTAALAVAAFLRLYEGH
ncbi:MAG: RsmE family RNA methyltransferase [Candidatus Omnitrophota bacterium]